VWTNGRWTIEREVTIAGERLVPFSPRNNLIRNEAVLLSSRPQDYGSEHELVNSIQTHINRYADLSPSFERVATPYPDPCSGGGIRPGRQDGTDDRYLHHERRHR
jgi:hypothetical protein